jgi:hypothetical protein
LKEKITILFGGGLKSAKIGDKEIQFYEKGQSQVPESNKPQDLQSLIPPDPTGLRDEQVVLLTQQLEQIQGDAQKIDVLVKNLAQQQIKNHFERNLKN